jgi:hypothetical protein
VSDPFDYRDPAGLELELDLPSAPNPRAAARPAPPSSQPDELPGLPDEFMELPDELTAPFPEPSPAPAATEAWSLELEDIAPPAVTPSIAITPRAAPAARAAASLALPQPTRPLEPPPVRTLELRIAQSVDRMSPFARGGLLALTIAAMLLLATSVLMAGVRSALTTMEELRQAGAAAAPSPGPAPAAAGERRDPYEAYRLDDVVDVDDDGRHLPQR